jgi:glycerol-3-phosphate dehydrogenase
MNREQMIQKLESCQNTWDVCIIGGGATGLGIAVDAASRGFTTLLAEQHDFAKGTSSRSTKLIHGGVRYLQQRNIKLVFEGLRERGLLRKNAPHLVKDQSFIIPNYKWWEPAFYGIGLKIYDWMAGSLGLGSSEILSRSKTLLKLPTLKPEGLTGGVLYHDCQFDDARLAINLAQTAADNGGVLANYMKVTGLIKEREKISGVTLKDLISGKVYEIQAKTVVNATGIFTDTLLKMDDEKATAVITLSQGIHLVFDKEFLPGEAALLVPSTDDGRVLFAVPWLGKTLVGTTDTPMDNALLEPVALREEINFVLAQVGKYLVNPPSMKDIRSVFAGLRPLVKGNAKSTAALPRDHLIQLSNSSLITITGGKWTTYRRMAEDTVNTAIKNGLLEPRNCLTKALKIHGWNNSTDYDDELFSYGVDAITIRKLIKDDPSLATKIHPSFPYTIAEIIWSVQNEMCMSVEDALARRTRALFLDAQAAIECAPLVASLLAREMNKDEGWQRDQINSFNSVAIKYLPANYKHNFKL